MKPDLEKVPYFKEYDSLKMPQPTIEFLMSRPSVAMPPVRKFIERVGDNAKITRYQTKTKGGTMGYKPGLHLDTKGNPVDMDGCWIERGAVYR